MSVGGSAGISYGNSSNYDRGNTWSSGDSLTFTGSGELDNGMSVVTYQEIDGGTLDDRYFSVEMDGLGKMTFHEHGGGTAMSAVDDTTPTAYGESWDLIGYTSAAAATSKLAAVSFTTLNKESENGLDKSSTPLNSLMKSISSFSTMVSYSCIRLLSGFL